MGQLIVIAIIVAFVVLFLHATAWEGMIFGTIAEKAFDWPEWIRKPLFECPICMAPWWGSLILVIFGLATGVWFSWWQWAVILFVAGGINTLIVLIKSND